MVHVVYYENLRIRELVGRPAIHARVIDGAVLIGPLRLIMMLYCEGSARAIDRHSGVHSVRSRMYVCDYDR